MPQSDCEQSDYKLCFKLKQYTPLIHFQANQKGATLRATEVKPKLDRFLLTKLGSGDYNAGVEIAKQKKWLIGKGEHPALDYKVRIEPNNNGYNKKEKLINYFGNQKGSKNKKYAKNYTGTFKVIIICFDDDLKILIENNFKAFLANNNFGTRQSKGYGCFYINNKQFDVSEVPFKVYSFESTKHTWQEHINLFYQFLRQGINRPKFQNREPVKDKNDCIVTRFYCKPFIFYYVNNLIKNKYTWVKREIKENYFSSELSMQLKCKTDSSVLEENEKEAYLVRDLFGLSTLQQWRSYGDDVTITKKSVETIIVNNKEVQKYSRFKSPILFKVFDEIVEENGEDKEIKKIYFWVNNTYKNFFNIEFFILKNNTGNLRRFTPKEFDFDDFFSKLLGIDLDSYIDSDYHETREYEQLKEIFDTLKEEA